MKIFVSKIQTNGAGYLFVDGTRTALPKDRASFVRQACDLRGLIGGEGLSYLTKFSPGGATIQAFSPDGSPQEFSANAALASAVYCRSLYKEETVSITQPGATCIIRFDSEDKSIKNCTIQDIDVFMLQDGTTDLKQFLGRPLADASLQSVGVCRVGRRQLIYDAETVDDRVLRRLGRRVNRHVTCPESTVAVSAIHRVDDNRLFLRTFSPNGGDLVTSCTASVAAAAVAAASLPSGVDESSSLIVFGVSGAAHVVVKDVPDSQVSARVDVGTRAAIIYQAEVDWDGQRFGDQMSGNLFLNTLGALADLADAELTAISVSEFYVPTPEGSS